MALPLSHFNLYVGNTVRLQELSIQNFRKIQELKIQFPPGLSVIVGENNSGKTAIIDALRLMLIPGRDLHALRINEDDFKAGTNYNPIKISCIFCDLTDDDEVHLSECLVDAGNGKFKARLNTRVEFNTLTRRANIRTWGGETEGGVIPSDLYDRIATIYLQPLRDPDKGLQPGRQSQVSRLINCLTTEEERPLFEDIAKDANKKIRDLQPVITAKDDLNSQMQSIAGEELAQKTELVFSDPAFHRIVAGLQPEIDNLPSSLNGLGYNNLLFTSATLGTLKYSQQFSYRSILVEEPEAHLHPQLQILLLRYLNDVTKSHDQDDAEKESKVQVVASSHSPILVSQAPIDSIISIHDEGSCTRAISIFSIQFDLKLKNKLQRFLNATRGELFFARKVILVEGIAEALLLPVLTKIAGGDLNESAVTVVNTNGINFNAFLPLFGEEKLSYPVAILTDGDAKHIGSAPSTTAQKLKLDEKAIKSLKVEYAEITLEHELARSKNLLPIMIDTFEILHKNLGKKLRESIKDNMNNDQKADVFLDNFLSSNTSKGAYAQELSAELNQADLSARDIPKYILEVLKFLKVVKIDDEVFTA